MDVDGPFDALINFLQKLHSIVLGAKVVEGHAVDITDSTVCDVSQTRRELLVAKVDDGRIESVALRFVYTGMHM